MRLRWAFFLAILWGSSAGAQSSQPNHAYLFPAGGQRGTKVVARIHGENVTTLCDFHLVDKRGVTAPAQARGRQVELSIAADAILGVVRWRIGTAQGGTGGRAFVIGDFPEIVERELGVQDESAPVVQLPVTVNGRINPAGDVDRFSVDLKAGERFSAEVIAARLGGPIDTNVFVGQFGNPTKDITYKQLDASLEIYGPDGKLLAQDEDTFGVDPAVGLVAPATGRYVIAVHHLAHLGRPQFVYRLNLSHRALAEAVYPAGGQRGTTVNVQVLGRGLPAKQPGMGQARYSVKLFAAPGQSTVPARLIDDEGGSTPFVLRVGEYPELLEVEPNGRIDQAMPVELPATLNGQFLTAGDTDTYRFDLRKGEVYRFEAWVERLGSPTDATLAILDANGRTLASNDDTPGSHDPRLWFTAPADGSYLLQIRDAGLSRMGSRLVYRLEAWPQEANFTVGAGPEAANVAPGGTVDLAVTVERSGGFGGDVTFSAVGLPPGVSVQSLTLKGNQAKGKLRLEVAKEAKPGSWPIQLLARGDIEGREVTRRAVVRLGNAAALAVGSAPGQADSLLLTILYPVPFQIAADDSYVFMNLGTVYPAKINVTREAGFTAPLKFTMADRQPRNPFGITFPEMTVTDQSPEVFFPMWLPQGPRGNIIVRVYVKAEAVVKAADGREWHLLHTSPKQVVLRTVAPLLSLSVEPRALRVRRGETVRVVLRAGRTAKVSGPAMIRLRAPEGMRGITMEPVALPAGVSEAVGIFKIAPDAELGPRPQVRLEITAKQNNGYTVFYLADLGLDLLD